MKTFIKAALMVSALVISAGASAHYWGYGFGMMNSNNPQYKTMQALHQNSEAMQKWRDSMRNDPQARQQWMQQMHANGGRGQHFAMRGNCGGTPAFMGRGLRWQAQPGNASAPAPAPKVVK
jgi:hypothetical protein